MRAAGPVVDPLPCSGCSKLIDPLRAGHVAIFDLCFHYFCNARCRVAFLGESPPAVSDGAASQVWYGPHLRRPREAAQRVTGASASSSRADAVRAGNDDSASRLAEFDAPILDAFPPVSFDDRLPELPILDDDRSLLEPIAHTILSEEPQRYEGIEARDIGALLLVLAIIAGTLAVALSLAGDTTLVIGARIVLAAVSAGMLVGRAATTLRDATDPHPAPMLAPVLGALVAAIWAAFGQDRALAAEAASLAGVIATASAVSAWLIESARHRIFAERSWIASVLAASSHHLPGSWNQGRASTDRSPLRASDSGVTEGSGDERYELRPGESVQVDAGGVVPVDLMVTGGDVDVLPWIGATTTARRRDGDPVIAGASVVRGRLRGACTFSGDDRAAVRVLLDNRRRADARAPIAQAARALTERWAFAAGVIGALSAFVAGRAPVEVAMTAVAVVAALSTAITGAIPSVHVARGILLGLRRGIVYKSADAWDRAGRMAVAVFCARGTLLLGEPELAELEATGQKLSPSEVLALAAGAERTEEHPVATAIVRAARVRNVRPDGVRNPNFYPGLGVTAVTSTGEELCVGNRALMLEQRISIAVAESRITELEALGRTVVLVAVGARLAGIIGLQDGLRPGARAAIQHLLDAQIEPVLMSGDARETCEAIGRSLDVDHIRPEVLPADRGAEVRRLIGAGTSVAVLGHAGVDDAALGAADVSIALGAAGCAPGDFAVVLASDDVRDAALSLALAHRTRLEARVGLALSVVPALVGSAVISAFVLPPAYAPLAAVLGGVMAVVHARALDARG